MLFKNGRPLKLFSVTGWNDDMKLVFSNWFCKCGVSTKIFEKDRIPEKNKDKDKLETQRFGGRLKKS